MTTPDNALLHEQLRDHVSPDAQVQIMRWLTEPRYAEYADEVRALIAQQAWGELEDAFFKVIEFGTGGRRGTTGVGSNRINRVTIGESAQALCQYATKLDASAPDKGIVIAYDTRLTSAELSRYAASVCAANGFRVYMFDGFRATPELSFAVRHLQAAAGIVISASHNPPADNGFKAYWDDGAQLVAPHDKGLLDEVATITTIADLPFDEAIRDGRIELIGQAVDDAYHTAVVAEAMTEQRDLSIVYSPLHGAGQTSVLPVLQKAGFGTIQAVDEQMVPDGHFPTVPGGKANPEERAANDLAVRTLLEESADIAITNDPDADRIGVMVNQHGQAIYLNGNQTAALAADFVLRHLDERGQLTGRHYLAKTIVTTDLLTALADQYGITMYTNLPVGFKYIGELIRHKQDGQERFVLGGEESYGLLKGDYARDKDGAVGALLLAEYAAELKADGRTLYDRLLELFGEHGLYHEALANVQLPGADGFRRMQAIMAQLRDQSPTQLAGQTVSAVADYQTLTRRQLSDGQTEAIECLAGNVLVFELGNPRRRVTVRPSGTEPKLKLYLQWHQPAPSDQATIPQAYDNLRAHLDDLLQQMETELTSLA